MILLVWLLNRFQLVTIYWLVCRDRNLPLCHIRVSLTSCIGAGHIIFFAGIDFTENQVTLWTSCSCNCLFVYLYLIWSQLLNDLKTDWSIEWFFFLFLFFFFFFPLGFACLCLFWFLFLSVFRIIISANTICGKIITLLRIIYFLQAACVAVAALMQYFLMASFCWMLVEGIYIYLFVVKVYNISDKMYRYHGFCWGEEHCQQMGKMG